MLTTGDAAVAQLAERQLPKLDVAGSTPVSRSSIMEYSSKCLIVRMPILLSAFLLYPGCSGDDPLESEEIQPSIQILYPMDGFKVSGEANVSVDISNEFNVDSTLFDIVGVIRSTFEGKREAVVVDFSDSSLFENEGVYSIIVRWWGKEGIFSDTSSFSVDMLSISRITSKGGSVEIFNTVPAYTPDSVRIVIQSQRTGNMEIFSLLNSFLDDSPDDGLEPPGPITAEAVNLTQNSSSDIMPFFWSDGDRVIYSSNATGRYQLRLTDVDSMNFTQLTDDSVDLFFPSGSPDGRFIAYERDNEGESDIWLLDLTDTLSSPLVQRIGSDGNPSFSPAGDEIVFHSNFGGTFDIWKVPAGGGDSELLIGWNSNEKNPVYSPNGDYLAFTSDRAGNDDIWLYRFSDGSAVQMTSHSSDEDFVSFHNSEDEILFSSFRDGNRDIFRLKGISRFY